MAAPQPAREDPTKEGLTSTIAGIEIDWPRSVGYFGAVGAAVAFDLISPPVGIFIAAVPFLKMLNRPGLETRKRFVGHLFEGAAKPVGGDSEGTIRLVKPEALTGRRRRRR